MKINEKIKTIELTKAEMKDAMTVGSELYRLLQEARRDYPGFKPVVERPKRNTSDFSGLDMKTIRLYVTKHGTEKQKNDFALLSERTITEDGEYREVQSFFEIKKWFLNEFPEIKQARKDYREKVLEIYRSAEAKAEAAA